MTEEWLVSATEDKMENIVKKKKKVLTKMCMSFYMWATMAQENMYIEIILIIAINKHKT